MSAPNGSTRTPIANPNFDPVSSGSVEAALHHVDQALESSSHTEATTADGLVALHKVTPLLRSEVLSDRTGHNVWLKLDALQPSGSFKIRGVGRVCSVAFAKYGSQAHLVTASGGNAGLAAATACQSLGLKCTVYVPSSTEDCVVKLLRDGLNAEVIKGGDSWDHCDREARALVESQEGAVYIHPFAGEDLLDGHASLSQEIYQQLAEQDSSIQPDIISCTVGGGGMIQGIMRGLSQIQTHRSDHVPPKLVATQDFGADSFSQSVNLYFADPEKNAEAHITLPAITSKATSMGCKKCSGSALHDARRYAEYGSVNDALQTKRSSRHLSTVTIEDAMAGSACWQFKRDHDLLVELSCGAALAPVYHDRILRSIVPADLGRKANIVVVVCGGSKVDLTMLQQYEEEYGDMANRGKIQVDGRDI